MYPIVRVEKRIPDGSIWQRYRGYRLPDVHGVTRVFLPGGTRWWNTLGGWTTPTAGQGIALFPPGLPFVLSCHGPAGAKRFYIDIVRASTVSDALIEYLDLYLDVLIDPAGSASEKDEEQLHLLDAAEQVAVRRARDDVRTRIAARDPMFDPTSEYYAIPPGAAELEPLAA